MSDSSSKTVIIKQEGSVINIELNRPDYQNAITFEMITAITETLAGVGEREDIRAVTFSGTGDIFCVGDTPDHMGDWPEKYRHRRPGGTHGSAPIPQQEMLKTIRNLAKPTIAIMQGQVLGLGLDLACVCDIRLCNRDTVFGDPRILQARHNTTGLTYILPRLIGQSQAVRVLLLGEQIEGTEAEEMGLVYKSFAPDRFDEESRKIVQQIAEMPTRSFAIIKQQILEELDMPYETALMHSLAIRQTNIIEDLAEGMLALREKRKPQFKGR